MMVFIGPEGWASERERDYERDMTFGTEPDTFAEEIEAQEYEERHQPLTPTQLELAVKAHHRARATDPVPPSYVKRSAA